MDFKKQRQAIQICKRDKEREMVKVNQMLKDEKDADKRKDIIEWQAELSDILLGLVDALQGIEALEKMQALFK